MNSQGHAHRISKIVEYVPPSPEGVHENPNLPTFYLGRATPNPFSRETQVSYAVPRLTRVGLSVHDIAGRKVRTLVDGEVEPGHHRVSWDGRDQEGRRVISGIYYVKMTTPEFERTTAMTMLR